LENPGYFGPDGIGLEVRPRGLMSAYFEGDGGHIPVRVRRIEKGTDVELITREWDHQVRKFMGKI
jgi:hypothetical protein